MFVVVTGSGNLSVFKRVMRASPCRCSRAATFTRVNGTVSCFCNKRLQN